MQLLVATRNRHKLKEIGAILAELKIDLRSAADIPGLADIVEDAPTVRDNAIKKAVETAKFAKLLTLADDTGLEVDALNGAPGVHSARYAGTGATDFENIKKLLANLHGVPAEKRTARFRCVIALVPVPAGKVESASPVCFADEFTAQIFDGACEGRVQFAASGHGGFGYDPLFVPNGFSRSFAELGEDVKNQLSHRAKALAKLKAYFSKLPS